MPGGVTSAFQFLSYKVDTIKIEMPPKIDTLINVEPVLVENIRYSIGFRNVSKFVEETRRLYIGGVNLKLELLSKKDESVMLSGEFGIAGVFSATNELTVEVETQMAKNTIPTILFPYLRSSITMILSGAGFGTVLFPLINVFETAKNTEIVVIEQKSE